MSPGPRRRTRLVALRALSVLLPALALIVLSPGQASALEVHHTFPTDGETLAGSPDHVEIMVDEQLRSGLAQVVVVPDATGTPLALPAVTLEGSVLVQALPALSRGGYAVGFRALGQDGHEYRATFSFTVAAAAGGAPVVGPAGGAPPEGPAGGAPARAAAAAAAPSGGDHAARSWLIATVALALAVVALRTRSRRHTGPATRALGLSSPRR